MFKGLVDILSGFNVFDASQSEISICGRTLEDFTKAKVTQSASSKVEQGVDKTYYAPIDIPVYYTLSIEVLPESGDAMFLRNLEQFTKKTKGYFEVYVAVSGRLVGDYYGHFISVSDVDINEEPEDNSFVIGLYKRDTAITQKKPNALAIPLPEINQLPLASIQI